MKRPSYVDMGPYPGWVGICFDPGTFEREMRRLGVENPPPFINGDLAHATTHSFVHPMNGAMNLVCVDGKQARSRLDVEMIGLLVHEAVHVKQHVFADIGEQSPGAEQEAYFVQHVAQWFARAWKDERRTKQAQPGRAANPAGQAQKRRASTDAAGANRKAKSGAKTQGGKRVVK